MQQWDVSSNYWTDYGCNCRGDLDRDASNLGKPIDALDKYDFIYDAYYIFFGKMTNLEINCEILDNVAPGSNV